MDATAAEYVDAYLAARRVATLATIAPGNGVWICSVYYAFTCGVLLFLSKPDAIHSVHVGDGANVAFAVTDSSQTPPASAHGIQAHGFARPAKYSEYPLFVRYYATMFPKYGENMGSPESLRAAVSNVRTSRPYVLIPRVVKLTDARFSAEPVTVEFNR